MQDGVSNLEASLVEVSKLLGPEDFQQFLELAGQVNNKGVLREFLKGFVEMVEAGSDPASSFTWAYYDAMAFLDNQQQ